MAANERCSPDIDANTRRGVALSIAETVIPYLNRAEGEAVIAALDRSHCGEVGGTDSEWLTLYAAVARRDAGLMAKMADSLLSAGHSGYSDRHRVYAIRVGLLGAMVRQDMNKARSFLERFVPVVFDGRRMPDDVRLLAAMVATAK